MDSNRDNVFTITLEGMPSDEGHVNMSDLSGFLRNFKSLLDKIEKKKGSKSSGKYRIINATHNSPLSFKIEPESMETYHEFNKLAENIRRDKVNSKEDYFILKSYSLFLKKYNKSFSRINISSLNTSLEITNEDKIKTNNLLEGKSYSYGSVTGSLEKLNIHDKNKKFTIYPLIGNEVECIVPEDLKEKIASFVNTRVRMIGKIEYSVFCDFPLKIYVKEAFQIPKDQNLPTPNDICGLYPNLTGDLSIEEYIKKQREGYIY